MDIAPRKPETTQYEAVRIIIRPLSFERFDVTSSVPGFLQSTHRDWCLFWRWMDRFSQSLAIIDYLETIHPETRFLPADPRLRCEVMSMALAIACDIHPLNNLRVLDYIRTSFGQCDEAVTTSYSHWIRTGLDALERKAASISSEPFLLGNSPARRERPDAGGVCGRCTGGCRIGYAQSLKCALWRRLECGWQAATRPPV
jgi:hypothetical protein